MIFGWILVAALVQGITEFLPVSSSGHLRIVGHLFDIDAPATEVDIALHLATLLSVLFVFRVQIWNLIARRQDGDASSTQGVRPGPLLGCLLLASIPAGALGILLGDALERSSADLKFLGGTYLANALILLLAHRSSRDTQRKSLSELRWYHALIIGLAQALAILRGISRSGSTITIALLLGFRAETAAFFSFLMAIPVIGGAAILKLGPLLTGSEGVGVDPAALAVGFIITVVVGIAALKLLLASARRSLWWPYVAYSLVLSATCFWMA
jgi:undecaprenyl-diphosphatase